MDDCLDYLHDLSSEIKKDPTQKESNLSFFHLILIKKTYILR